MAQPVAQQQPLPPTILETPQHPIWGTLKDHFTHGLCYGECSDRSLPPTLQRDPIPPVAMRNRFAPQDDESEDIPHVSSSPHPHDITNRLRRVHFPSLPGDIQADNLLCYDTKGSPTDKLPRQPRNGLMPYMAIQAAQALSVHTLHVEPTDRVLHLRPGPGWRNSAALAQSLWPHLQQLSLSGPSGPPGIPAARIGALHVIFGPGDALATESYLSEVLPEKIKSAGDLRVITINASNPNEDLAPRLPFGRRGYDKVYIDARSVDTLDSGCAESAVQQLIFEQHVLTRLALEALRVGGHLLYACQSMMFEECDGVIQRRVKIAREQHARGEIDWDIVPVHSADEMATQMQATWAEKTHYGWLVLPDHPAGHKAGPLYFSLMQKTHVGFKVPAEPSEA